MTKKLRQRIFGSVSVRSDTTLTINQLRLEEIIDKLLREQETQHNADLLDMYRRAVRDEIQCVETIHRQEIEKAIIHSWFVCKGIISSDSLTLLLKRYGFSGKYQKIKDSLERDKFYSKNHV